MVFGNFGVLFTRTWNVVRVQQPLEPSLFEIDHCRYEAYTIAPVCVQVYNAVRDEKYLVGKRLMNVDATTDHATDAIAPVPPAPIAVDA